MSSGLIVVETDPGSPAGLLSWDAWSALREARTVYAAGDLDPQWWLALETAGVRPEELEATSPPARARELMARARQARIVWFGVLRTDQELARELAAAMLEPGETPEFEVILGSWTRPGSAVLDLVAVMDRLRSPGGCPWDAEQTHASLVPYALEEAYEVAEAVETGTREDLIEELGDLLLQVVFHARLGQEWDEPFGLDEIATGITGKLRRRHPHVFADVEAATAAQVSANWEQIKQEEKQRASVFDGVPVGLPALARAEKVLGRFERAGLPVPPPEDEASIGRALLGLAGQARRLGLDPEAELRAAVRAIEETGRQLEVNRPVL